MSALTFGGADMGRLVFLVALPFALGTRFAAADPAAAIRCDNLSTAELSIDGLLDDWPRPVLVHAGTFDVRCSWDGTALAVALDVRDDKIVRVRSGRAHEDHVVLEVSAGHAPTAIHVFPGNAIAKARITVPRRVVAADSLQPHGFSIEVRVPAAAIAGLTSATPALELRVVFHDSDAATGGADTDTELRSTIELGDRADLLDDLLRATKLARRDIRVDTTGKLDAALPGVQRVIAAGTVIAVLADQFAYVSLPVERATDVHSVQLLPIGLRGHAVIGAVVTQRGGGGSRDLLLLWTVSGGQLVPLGQLEVGKHLGAATLAATWRVVPGAHPALVVEPAPAVGITAATWNEEAADDADPLVLPWDPRRGGIAYTVTATGLARRDLPKRR